MMTRRPIRILIATIITIALLPTLPALSPASADQIWYQSVGRVNGDASCEKSTATELVTGWTHWGPSWDTWVNGGKGGFVCNRQITWAFDSVPFSCAAGAGATGTCVVGNTGPGGGIVFYVNEAATTGARYMEAALSGWNTGADPALEWGVNTGGVDCSTLNIAGAVGTAIGTGRDNTNAITTACTAAQAPAAWAARNYTGGGLATGSWFLPSHDELNQLCRYASSEVFDAAATTCTGSTTPVGGFHAASYWSSSQNGATSARAQYFLNGFQYPDSKFNSFSVRPFRAF